MVARWKALMLGNAAMPRSVEGPRPLVWKRVDGLVFEGRVSNRDSGWYHGYPITAAEMPRWLE